MKGKASVKERVLEVFDSNIGGIGTLSIAKRLKVTHQEVQEAVMKLFVEGKIKKYNLPTGLINKEEYYE